MRRLAEVSLLIATAGRLSALHACSVCFGGENAATLRAYNWGILLLLAFTFLILGSLAVAVYKLEARRNEGLPGEH